MIDEKIVFNWIGFLHCHGLTIKEENGKLHVSPPEKITAYARDLIKRRKPDIINAFQAVREAYEERAAIMEYGAHDVYPTRKEAEKAALKDSHRTKLKDGVK